MPDPFRHIVESEEQRLIIFTRLLALFVLLCIVFSWKLWISSRLYPLVPVGGLIPAFPFPFDYIVLAMFSTVLIGLIVRPRSQLLLGLVVAAFRRRWPSSSSAYCRS